MTYKTQYKLETNIFFDVTEDLVRSVVISMRPVEVTPWWFALHTPKETTFISRTETKELNYPQPEEIQATLRLQAKTLREFMADNGHVETRDSRKKF